MSAKEDWRAVPGFEDLYEVSDLGRVKSLARLKRGRGNRMNPLRERILKATPCYGYLQVGLSEDGQVTYKKVHALVLTAFVGPRPEGMESRHLNGDRRDNHLANLCWGQSWKTPPTSTDMELWREEIIAVPVCIPSGWSGEISIGHDSIPIESSVARTPEVPSSLTTP